MTYAEGAPEEPVILGCGRREPVCIRNVLWNRRIVDRLNEQTDLDRVASRKARAKMYDRVV